MNGDRRAIRAEILKELETAQAQFQELLGTLSEDDFIKQSLNPGWTNGEILAHITFGFIVINVLLPDPLDPTSALVDPAGA